MNETFLGGHFHLAEGGHFQKFTGVIFIWSDGVNLHGFFHLMVQRGLTMQQAFDAVYTSRLFEKLSDPKTGLFFQSSGYVYSYLEEELNKEIEAL